MHSFEQHDRLTDEMERRLMMEAIEDQMRPRPIRALRAALHKLVVRIKSA